MRPTPGGDASVATSRSRKSSIADSQDSVVHSTPGPTDFFLASEAEVEKIRDQAAKDVAEGYSPAASMSRSKDSVYGVQSLEDALGEAFGAKPGSLGAGSTHGSNDPVVGEVHNNIDGADTPPVTSSLEHKARSVAITGVGQLHQHPVAVSQPLTPLQTASPAPDWSSNMPSTPKSGSLGSLRLSDEDSQVEVDDSGDEGVIRSGTVELVMPSLAMPARRPFTERGRRMGKLKICVAGRQGISYRFSL
jgi:hypothetical protein